MLQYLWQYNILSFSHFLEFTFFVRKNISAYRNNIYVDHVIKLNQQSFIQIRELINLINDKKILFLLNYKTKRKLFRTFESTSDIFSDLEIVKFYFKFKNGITSFFSISLANYFHIVFNNTMSWQTFISYFLTQSKKEKTSLINSLVKYINSNQYTIQFNNFADKFFESLEKIILLVSSTDDGDIKEILFNKMFSILVTDERYSILLPSFILNFIALFTNELSIVRALNLFSKELNKMNPLTMNANYYRMFLRDAYKIELNN